VVRCGAVCACVCACACGVHDCIPCTIRVRCAQRLHKYVISAAVYSLQTCRNMSVTRPACTPEMILNQSMVHVHVS
jgi:hypothetical protein